MDAGMAIETGKLGFHGMDALGVYAVRVPVTDGAGNQPGGFLSGHVPIQILDTLMTGGTAQHPMGCGGKMLLEPGVRMAGGAICKRQGDRRFGFGLHNHFSGCFLGMDTRMALYTGKFFDRRMESRFRDIPVARCTGSRLDGFSPFHVPGDLGYTLVAGGAAELPMLCLGKILAIFRLGMAGDTARTCRLLCRHGFFRGRGWPCGGLRAFAVCGRSFFRCGFASIFRRLASIRLWGKAQGEERRWSYITELVAVGAHELGFFVLEMAEKTVHVSA